MYRGTTPSFNFILPQAVLLDQLAEVFITFCQENETVFEFKAGDEEVEYITSENSIKVTLKQEHTLKLNADYKVQIQLRVKTLDGTAFASPVFRKDVEKILKDGVI